MRNIIQRMILDWRNENPEGKKKDCEKALKISKPTILKYWNWKKPEKKVSIFRPDLHPRIDAIVRSMWCIDAPTNTQFNFFIAGVRRALWYFSKLSDEDVDDIKFELEHYRLIFRTDEEPIDYGIELETLRNFLTQYPELVSDLSLYKKLRLYSHVKSKEHYILNTIETYPECFNSLPPVGGYEVIPTALKEKINAIIEKKGIKKELKYMRYYSPEEVRKMDDIEMNNIVMFQRNWGIEVQDDMYKRFREYHHF